jgi:hypothetical protein
MSAYALTAHDFAFGHFNQKPGLLNDLNEKPTPLDIESLVASGDIFAVLATEIDDAVLMMIRDPAAAVSSKLDKLTETLLYLQRRYQVIPKRPDYRQ